MKIQFAAQLLQLRKEKEISQEQLAQSLNVTRQTISKWELQEATPDLNKIQAIADYFQVPVEELLFGSNFKNKTIPASKNKKRSQPINNGWEFLARYFWNIIIGVCVLSFALSFFI